ncbi:MAG: VTT domain-containing protein [Nitrososphaerota archaeon]
MADIVSQISQLSSWVEELAVQYGIGGVFLASLLGSVVPFLPVPYLFVVVLLSETVEPWMLGVAAGLGGSFGKITSYFLGRSGYRLLSPQNKKKMDTLRDVIGKYGDAGVFIFAITPLPDDVYLIPVGMMRFNFWRFLLANTLGKIALASIVAYLGRTYFSLTRLFLGDVGGVSVLAAIVAMAVLTILLLRVDWELAVKIMREEGWRGVLRNLSPILSLGKNRR